MKINMILGRWSTGLHGQLHPRELFVRGRPLTGSESSFFHVARSLAEREHDVVVYCDCAEEMRGSDDLWGADVVSVDRELRAADAHVALNEPDQLRRAPNGLRVCWQQLGDHPGNQPGGFDDHVDVYVALSPRHFERASTSPLGDRPAKPEKWTWIPNSVDLALFEARAPRKPWSMAWCSSPDRGLHRLLEIFPQVRERVPGATLDVYYRFDPWYEIAKKLSDPTGDRARYIGECLSRLGRNGENGVRMWGPVPNKEMARRLGETVLFPYTCDCLRFTETFCVSALDACAAGCAVLLSDEDSLPSVFGKDVRMISGKPGSRRGEWIDAICGILLDEQKSADASERTFSSTAARQFAENFDRRLVVAAWEELFVGTWRAPRTMAEYVQARGARAAEEVNKNFVPELMRRNETGAPASGGPEVRDHEPPTKVTVEVSERPLQIAIFLGKSGSPVHGVINVRKALDVDGAFATGTVTGFLNIAWGLAERGHSVDAFCECAESVEKSSLGSASFYDLDRDRGLVVGGNHDVYLSISEPDLLRGLPEDRLKIAALWLNDFSYCQPGWDEHVDAYTCPSETHLLHLCRGGEVKASKIEVIPLCVSWELHDEALPRRPGSIAYCSSPDRGLHHLLHMFPDVKLRVPNANLSIYYRYRKWHAEILANRGLDGTHMRWRADQIRASLDDLGEDGSRGVTLVDAVSPRRMARELAQTRVLAYPCDPVRFTEGFGAAVLDACAAGCVPIVAGVDALPEVYLGAAHLVYGDPAERRKTWIDAICLALTDDGFAAEVRQGARARAREFSRAKVAAKWEAFMRRKIAR